MPVSTAPKLLSYGRTLLAACFACACAVVIFAGSNADGATATTNVTLSVVSATALGAGGCATNTPNVTAFGTIQPNVPYTTGADCALTFGSTNDSSMLRVFQQ